MSVSSWAVGLVDVAAIGAVFVLPDAGGEECAGHDLFGDTAVSLTSPNSLQTCSQAPSSMQPTETSCEWTVVPSARLQSGDEVLGGSAL